MYSSCNFENHIERMRYLSSSSRLSKIYRAGIGKSVRNEPWKLVKSRGVKSLKKIRIFIQLSSSFSSMKAAWAEANSFSILTWVWSQKSLGRSTFVITSATSLKSSTWYSSNFKFSFGVSFNFWSLIFWLRSAMIVWMSFSRAPVKRKWLGCNVLPEFSLMIRSNNSFLFWKMRHYWEFFNYCDDLLSLCATHRLGWFQLQLSIEVAWHE